MIDIFREEDTSAVIEHAGEALNLEIQSKKTGVLLLLSGGSTIQTLDQIEDTSFPLIDMLAMLDERFTFTIDQSNYFKLRESDFYNRTIDYGTPFFSSLPSKRETLNESAMRYAAFLDEWKTDHPNGRIITTMGIGKDGHTAGIFPKPREEFEALFEQDHYAVGHTDANAPEIRERITVTNTFLRKIDAAIVLACGKEKKQAIIRTKADSGFLHETPARIIHEMKRVTLCTDMLE